MNDTVSVLQELSRDNVVQFIKQAARFLANEQAFYAIDNPKAALRFRIHLYDNKRLGLVLKGGDGWDENGILFGEGAVQTNSLIGAAGACLDAIEQILETIEIQEYLKKA